MLRICVLQRGWVYVGNFVQDGEECRLEKAFNVRRWGTTKGLGELAEKGPQPNTLLDPSGVVRFHVLTVVATLDCNEAAWSGKLDR